MGPLVSWRSTIVLPTAALALVIWASSASAAAGDLDPSFGSGGIVTTSFGTSAAGAQAAAIRASDGSIVAAGYAIQSNHDVFALAKYQPNGSLDPSFGGGTGTVTTVFPHRNAQALAVAIQQTTGKIVAAGFVASITFTGFALARYNPDGTLDTTFSHDGMLTTDFGNHGTTQAHALAILGNGKIVAAGFAAETSSVDYALARYTDAGALDPSFGAGGIVTTDFFNSQDEINGIAVQPNGKLVVAGLTHDTTTEFSVARYNVDGTLDQGFGVGGVQFTAFETDPNDSAAAVRLGSSGRILVAGTAAKNTPGAKPKFAVARYVSSGALDTSFSGDGKTTTAIGSGVTASGMGIEPGGGIVVSGTTGTNPPDFSLALARYTPTGALDAGFGAGGIVTTDLGADERAYGMRIQPDGRIVVAGVGFPQGSVISHFLLARYKSA